MFVIRKEAGYLEVVGGKCYWREDLQDATKFHRLSDLLSVVVRAVKERPLNWNSDNEWILQEVRQVNQPQYVLTGKYL